VLRSSIREYLCSIAMQGLNIATPKRPIINRQAKNRHIVSIHNPMCKTLGLPIGKHFGGAFDHLIEKINILEFISIGG
jgi:hypothetical protein